MRHTRWTTFVMLPTFSALSVLAAGAPAPERPTTAMSIKAGVERSPNKYLAAIVEVTAAPNCEARGENRQCTQPARVVELFASKGVALRIGAEITLLGEGDMGSQVLGFLVPMPDAQSTWAATFLSTSVDEASKRAFIADLRKSGLQPVAYAHHQPARVLRIVIYQGAQGDYYWLASHHRRDHLPAILDACPEIVLQRFVAITSFDSGPLEPSREEVQAGWWSDGRIMYSPRIVDPTTIPHEQYDEWLIFSQDPRRLPPLEVFINFGMFTLAEAEEESERERQVRLWSQLARVSAETYLAEGDHFLFASTDRTLHRRVHAAITGLHAA